MLSNMRAEQNRDTEQTMRISQVDNNSSMAQKRYNTGFEYGWCSKPQSADNTAGARNPRSGQRRVEELLSKAGIVGTKGKVEVLELHMKTPPVADGEIVPDDQEDPYKEKVVTPLAVSNNISKLAGPISTDLLRGSQGTVRGTV